jgi:hypothetical protein
MPSNEQTFSFPFVMVWVAGWLRQKPQAEAQKQKKFLIYY